MLLSATQIGTDAWGVGDPITVLRDALERRSRNPLTPYKQAWVEQLSKLGLEGRYPQLVQSLAKGFNMGISRITSTYTPSNHPSLKPLADVCSKIIENEFKVG